MGDPERAIDLQELRAEFDRREWAEAYQNTAACPDGFDLQTEGTIPAQLEGTYFRNGPGLFSHGGQSVMHPFDGHGLVSKISFKNGKAHFRSRYVETKEWRDETAQDRVLYPGTFGTKPVGGFFTNFLKGLSPRNPANTGLVSWGGKLLALFEAGQPYALDQETLETKGIDLLGGEAQRGVPFSTGSRSVDRIAGFFLQLFGVGRNMEGGFRLGGHAVSAHPAEDLVDSNLVIFAFRLQMGLVKFSLQIWSYLITLYLPSLVTKLWIHEFDANFEHKSVVEEVLPGYAFLHDINVTAQHYVIFCNPVRLSMLPLILGTASPAHCIEWTLEPAKIHLQQRPGRSVASGNSNLQQNSVSRRLNRGDSAQELLCQPDSLKGSPDSSADFVGRPSRIVPSDSIKCASPGFVFHQASAFYDEAGKLIIDCIRYPTMPDFRQGTENGGTFMETVDTELQPISQLYRYTVDLQACSSSETLLCERAMEFPTINPLFAGRSHKYVWTVAALHPTANRPPQAICKLDLDSGKYILWSRGLRYYVGEPVFVPMPNGKEEEEGWILSVSYDASRKTSECVILSAANLELLAAIDLKQILPHGLHGDWAPRNV